MSGKNHFAELLRRGLCGWLGAVTLELLLLPAGLRGLQGLDGLRAMSPLRVLALTLLLTAALYLPWLRNAKTAQRWAFPGLFAVCTVLTLSARFSVIRLAGCLAVLALLTVYALRGWDDSPELLPVPEKPRPIWAWATAILALLFFLYISFWTVIRLRTRTVSTYDIGIFSQMFSYMRRTGAPLTTLERDGLLSHFKVHVSPIFYLMLPFYCLVPRTETLQVLQAAVMASAVIPLWKLGGLHGLTGPRRFLLCAVLLLTPAFAGGAGYDLHENCFLTPLLFWLFWGLDRGNRPVTYISAALTLCVKEDAAVYVAVVGIFILLRALLRKERRGQWKTGLLLLGAALLWFLAVTTWLSRYGDGVMTDRYDNLIYDGSGSLLAMVKAVLICPMKALSVCIQQEKLRYIALTMGVLLALPLATRRYERLVLLIPWVLVNLLSDNEYQHYLFIQYSFGSLACLLYLVCLNLAPRPLPAGERAAERGEARRRSRLSLAALALTAVISAVSFVGVIVPVCVRYARYDIKHAERNAQVRAALAKIPREASVTADPFCILDLSDRDVLYDLFYTTQDKALSTDYVVVATGSELSCYASVRQENGLAAFLELLETHGYRLVEEVPGQLAVYRR